MRRKIKRREHPSKGNIKVKCPNCRKITICADLGGWSFVILKKTTCQCGTELTFDNVWRSSREEDNDSAERPARKEVNI